MVSKILKEVAKLKSAGKLTGKAAIAIYIRLRQNGFGEKLSLALARAKKKR